MDQLPRTFVSFSSSDKRRYDLMTAWKANDNIAFNFADFQLEEAIKSTNRYYIRARCVAKIRRADTFVLLIGEDTWNKTDFVQPEVEAAILRGCRLIGVNLNNCRFKDGFCPSFFADKGAVFVSYSPHILALALKHWQKGPPVRPNAWFFYDDDTYARLGYELVGDTAVWPEPINPFAGGYRPPWAK